MPIIKNKLQKDESFEIDSSMLKENDRNYNVISFEDRLELIEKVCFQNQQLLKTAGCLGIKLSTAKYIVRSFRRQGKIMKKKSESSFGENIQLKQFYQNKLKAQLKKLENLRQSEGLEKNFRNKSKQRKETNFEKEIRKSYSQVYLTDLQNLDTHTKSVEYNLGSFIENETHSQSTVLCFFYNPWIEALQFLI